MSEVCPDCNAPFADPAELVAHVRKAHAGGDPVASLATNPYSHLPGFTCSLCGRVFDSPEALARHDLRPHPRSRPQRMGRGVPA